ncbi:MAG: SGNH/GDSL hydrolase family protein [Rhodanobacteraceae bacterium]|nr:SGNH/GDSL hydrolase family protein [Rhodanobacteraceae bacterium]
MLMLYKILLAPALLLQAAHLRRTALRLPEAAGPRSGWVGNAAAEPLRLLFVGDSSAAGVGVEWQHEAMAQQTAQLVAAASLRHVHWELIARSGAKTCEAVDLVNAQACQPADILISALGVNDVTSQKNAQRFIRDYKRLLAVVAERTGATAAVISGLPPMHILPAAPQPLRWYLGQCARRLDKVLRRHCSRSENTKYVSLSWAQAHEMARDKFHPGKDQYAYWSRLVAEQVLSLLPNGPIVVRRPGSVSVECGASAGSRTSAAMQ